jgi:hypothetical protein
MGATPHELVRILEFGKLMAEFEEEGHDPDCDADNITLGEVAMYDVNGEPLGKWIHRDGNLEWSAL